MSEKFTRSKTKILKITDEKTGHSELFRGNRKQRRVFMRANKLKVAHRTPVKTDASAK